jgi:hypothetical protein
MRGIARRPIASQRLNRSVARYTCERAAGEISRSSTDTEHSHEQPQSDQQSQPAGNSSHSVRGSIRVALVHRAFLSSSYSAPRRAASIRDLHSR